MRYCFRLMLSVMIVSAALFSRSVLGALTLPPRPSGPVADYADIIDQETRIKISSVARNLWVDRNIGLIVVTVESTGDIALSDYVTALDHHWRVSGAMDRTTVLTVVCRTPSDVYVLMNRGTTMNINGMDGYTGFSGYTDIREGNFSDGLLVLVAELVRKLNGSRQEVVESKTITLYFSRGLIFLGILCSVLIVYMRVVPRFLRQNGDEQYSGFRCSYSHGQFLGGKYSE